MNITIKKISNGYILTCWRAGYDKNDDTFCRTKEEILKELERKLSTF